MVELKKLAKNCGFQNLENDLIRDRIVVGLRSKTLKERLLREGNLTLDQAVDICRAEEQSRKGIQLMEREPEIRAVNKYSRDRDHQQKERLDRNKSSATKFQCGNCGREHGPRSCPAFGKICSKCGKTNHFKIVCRAQYRPNYNKRSVHDVEIDDMETTCDEDESHLYIDALKTKRENNQAYITAHIMDCSVRFKIDTGAQANVLPFKTFKEINKKREIKLYKTKQKLCSYSGNKLNTKGKCFIDVMGNKISFFVVDTVEDAILGLEASEQLELVKIMMLKKDKLEHKEDAIFRENNDVFSGIGKLENPYHIELNPNAEPVIHPPRRVPLALHERVREELDKMEQMGIVEKQQKPTDWVNSMVIVEKKDGSLRICIDPKDLNKAIKREHYAIPSADEISAKLAGAKYFSKFDAKSGFWQIPLDEPSSKLCTMNTPFGRYSFLRCPFGISSAPEVFNKRMKEIFGEEEGIESFFDDVLVWGKTKEELNLRTNRFVELARKANLTFGKAKSVIGAESLKYLGHVISSDGTKPDPEKIDAIQQLKIDDKQKLQRFLGMVTYVGKYIPNLSDITKPLRMLLEKDIAWHWTTEHEEAVKNIKERITHSPTLRHFDPSKDIVITADASQYGLGAALLQEGQPIYYASRSLSKTEMNYAQIEKETLAVVFGCEKFHQFIYGRHVNVENDHKPLQFIFVKPLNKCPPRIQRFLMRLQRYNISLKYVPGKHLVLADTLSRDPTLETSDKEIERESEIMVHNIIQNIPMSHEKDSYLRKLIAENQELQILIKFIKEGWPVDKTLVPWELRPFWDERDTLTYEDGRIFRGEQIFIPQGFRKEVLNKIHEGHLGIEKCKRRARESVYWPRMPREIEEYVSRCDRCLTYRNRQPKETIRHHGIPDYPWQKVASDIFTLNGKNYILVVDYLSKFVEISMLNNMRSANLVVKLKSIFSRHGIPELIITDNGPNYASAEFKEFTEAWGIKHITSSPRYPQSNGLAERSVQTLKRLLMKNEDPYLAILNFRTTPTKNSKSPSEILMGRKLRTTLPTNERLFKTPTTRLAQTAMSASQDSQGRFYKGRRDLPTLSPGDDVLIRSQDDKSWRPAKIVKASEEPRSFIATTDEGSSYRRNRRDIIKPTSIGEPKPTTNSGVPIETSNIVNNPPEVEASAETSPESSTYRTRSGRAIIQPARYEP